ncbi:hypothetical protein ACFWGZ_33385, partial [Lentzea sp. NPDC060358]
LAHETLHYLGIPDEYKDSSRVFQQHDTNSGVHQNDGGLMGADVHLPDPGIRPRHLWLIENTANSQVMVPDTTINPAGPATVPPPADWKPGGQPGTDANPNPGADTRSDGDTRSAPATDDAKTGEKRGRDDDAQSNTDDRSAKKPNTSTAPYSGTPAGPSTVDADTAMEVDSQTDGQVDSQVDDNADTNADTDADSRTDGDVPMTDADADTQVDNLVSQFDSLSMGDVTFSYNPAFADLANGTIDLPTKDNYLAKLKESVEAGKPPSFVVNMIVSHGQLNNPDVNVNSVIEAITKDAGPRAKDMVFVIGVNGPNGSDVDMAANIDQAKTSIAGRPEPIALVPLPTFDPKGGFPFGTMRNETMHSPANTFAIGAMNGKDTHPYISFQDFDAGSRKVTGDKKDIFNHVAESLNPKDVGPIRPLLYSGGYRVGDPATLVTDTQTRIDTERAKIDGDPKLSSADKAAKKAELDVAQDQINRPDFADRFQQAMSDDMDARSRQKDSAPLLPYSPEPNLFMDANVAVVAPEVKFSKDGNEFGGLSQSINAFAGAEVAEIHTNQLPPPPAAPGVQSDTDVAADVKSTVDSAVDVDLKNNRNPYRGENFTSDFKNGAVGTDLSRLALGFAKSEGKSWPQSHVALTSVTNRMYGGDTPSADRAAKADVSGAKIRDEFGDKKPKADGTPNPKNKPHEQREAQQLVTHEYSVDPNTGVHTHTGSTGGWTPSDADAKKLGSQDKNTLNTAVSAPVDGHANSGIDPQAQAKQEKMAAMLNLALSANPSNVTRTFGTIEHGVLPIAPAPRPDGMFNAVHDALAANPAPAPSGKGKGGAVPPVKSPADLRAGAVQKGSTASPAITKQIANFRQEHGLENGHVVNALVEPGPAPRPDLPANLRPGSGDVQVDHTGTPGTDLDADQRAEQDKQDAAEQKADNAKAAKAEELAAKLLATEIGRPITVHGPDGTQTHKPFFEPAPEITSKSSKADIKKADNWKEPTFPPPVELDAHPQPNGKTTFTPHDPSPSTRSAPDADVRPAPAPQTRPAPMPGSFPGADVDTNAGAGTNADANRGGARPQQTHLPNLGNGGLVESVLRSAALQGAPVPNASPLVGQADVQSTVDLVVDDVRQNPQNHDHAGLNPPALSNWAASQVSPDLLAKFHPDLEPNVPGPDTGAKLDQWRDALANDLATGSSRRWQLVNAGLDTDAMTQGDLELVDHVTQQVVANGALPTSADLVATGLETPSWADSQVARHLPDSIAQALDVQLVVDNDGVQSVHGPAGAPQVEIAAQNGTFGALGAATPQDVRAGMEASFTGKSSAEVEHALAGLRDQGLRDAAQRTLLFKEAAAHPGGPNGFAHDLATRSADIRSQIDQVKSKTTWKPEALQTQKERAQEAARKQEIKELTRQLGDTKSRLDTIRGAGSQPAMTHAIDNFVAGPNADMLEKLGPNAIAQIDAHLTEQIAAAENAGFDTADLKALQERVQNEPVARKVLTQASVRGLDSITTQLDDAKEALQNYRDGKSANTGFGGFLNRMLGNEVDSSVDFDQKIAQAEALVRQTEHQLSLAGNPDYANRFQKAADLHQKVERAREIQQEIEDGAERRRDLDRRWAEARQRVEDMLANQGAPQPNHDAQSDVDVQSDYRPDADAQSDVDADVDARSDLDVPSTDSGLSPRQEHAAFKASLYGKTGAELNELAAQHAGNPDRSYEIEQMTRYQEIAAKPGGLQQHLKDLQTEITETRGQVGDLKRVTDALPDALKSELMRSDQAQRQAEQQRLIDHQRQLHNELMNLQFDRADALTTHALTLPADPNAPGWQSMSPQDVEVVENRVTDLIRDARIGGQPTPQLDQLFDTVREIRIGDSAAFAPVDAPPATPDHAPAADADAPAPARQNDAPPAPAAEVRPERGPFMQDPAALPANPDMDLVVPGGFGPVHEGTPARSFEASLYGLDTRTLRDLQTTYGRDADRLAAVQGMTEVARNAGPPSTYDKRTQIAREGLAKAQADRARWNASDLVPNALKTQAMLDEQVDRRARADRDVRWHQNRVDQLTANRDASLTAHALTLPADPNAPGWRQFGNADLAAVQSHAEQKIRDAAAGGHPTGHLTAFRDFTQQLRDERAAGTPEVQHRPAPPKPDTRPAPPAPDVQTRPAPEQGTRSVPETAQPEVTARPEVQTRPAPPRPTPNPVVPMTTAAPQPVGQVPGTNLPGFFQDNKALGSITPTDVRGADAVVAEIQGIKPADAARIKDAVENDFETFLGGGRNFQVKIGGSWFEANIRAEMHADASTAVTDAAGTKVDRNYQAAAASTTTNTIATSNDVGGSVTAGTAMGPYGSVGGKAALATPAVSQSTTNSITEQRAIKGSDDGSVKVTVPVSYEITVTDASGNPKQFATLNTGPDVTLQVPKDLSTMVDSGRSSAAVTPADAAWGTKAENVVPEAVVVKDSGKAFEDVAAKLHPSITKVGSPGREALQNFLSPTSIRANLPAMLGGFVTSPDLISPHAGKGAAVQMTATLKDAKLVGTHDGAALDIKDTSAWGSSVSASTKTGFDANAGFGGNIGVPGQVGGTVGATVNYSARTAEGVNAGSSSSHKTGIGVKGETGLYEVTAEVEVRTPSGDPVKIEVTTHVRMGLNEAGAVGLPTPEGTRNTTTDPATKDTRHLPPYVADTLAAGNAKVGEFVPATQVQGQVETALRELPGFEKFLPKWNNPDANPRSSKGQGFGDVAEQLANQRKLTANLSPAALKANMDSLLGPGVQVQLKNSGKTTNTYVNVTVKAKLSGTKHLGQADKHAVSDSTTTGPKLDANTSTTKGWTGGVQGRVNIPVKTGVASLSPSPQVGASYSHSWTDKTSAGPAVSATSSNPGSADAQVFQGDVEFEVEITTFTRPRTWVRTIVPGAPGFQAPEVKTVARTGAGLDKIDGKVNLWVSDGSTLKNDPGDGFKPGDPRATKLDGSPTVKDLLNPRDARPKSPEFLNVEAVANTTALRDQAIDALNRAAKGDSALTTPGTASRAQIDKMFAPENIKANLQRLVETGVQEQGLKYDRRVTDRSGAIGMSVKLGEAKLVSISDTTGSDNSVSGGYKAGESSTTSRSVDLTAGVNVPVRPNVTPPPAGSPSQATGSGGAAVTGKVTPWSDSKTDSSEIGGTVDRGRTTPGDARTVLVQLDAEFTIVGESRAGNFVHGGTPNAEGVTVSMPKSVFVRVSEDVARELGALPKVAPNVPKPDFPKMAPPSTVAPNEPGALGLSNVEKVPDLSAAVNDLTGQLSANTKKFGSDALIPDSVLKDSMSNLQRIVDLNSPSSVKAMIDSALDGGVPLLVHQPGTFGKDSYQVTLRAKAGDPQFDQVVNDGVDMSHNTGGSRKESAGQGRGTGWGVGLRAPGLASPGSANPNVSGSAGVSAGANIGSSRSSSVTTSANEAFSHSRTASGPAARYSVPIEFELVVEKGSQEVAKARSGVQDMVVRTHADNQKVSEPTTSRGTPQPYMSAASRRGTEFGTPEAAFAFQQDTRATQLPPSASVENLRGAGDLRDAAVKAMTEAGAGKGLTGKGTGSLNSLFSTLSPENLQPHLPSMLSGPLDVPGLKEAALAFGQDADVKVYAKLVNPQLGSLSDSVKIETPLSTRTTDTSSEGKVADTADVSVGLAQGSAAVKQGTDPKDTVNFGTGGVELRHANEESSAVSGGPSQAEGGAVKPKDAPRTGLVQFDVEYRVVATVGGKTGVVDLTVPGSAGVRLPAAEAETVLHQQFGDSLEDAQTEVKKTADDWREAEKKVDEARHRAQDAINSSAAVLAKTDQPLGDAATKLNTAIDTHLNAEAELRARQTAFDTAVADVAQTRATIQDLTPRLSSLSQDALATKDALDDAQIAGAPQAELDRLGREADAAHTALTDAQQQLTDAHAQLDAQRKTAVDTRAEFQAQQKTVADADAARTDAEDAHKALADERAAAEKAIRDAETELDDARRVADAEQRKWWDAKAEVDRQVDAFNSSPPPVPPTPAPPTTPPPPPTA